MSDSGRTPGQCQHGNDREWCPHCLRAEIERLCGTDNREVSCVWCGHHFITNLQSQAEELYQHAKVCDKHPVKKVEAENARLRQLLRDVMVYASPDEEFSTGEWDRYNATIHDANEIIREKT